MPDAALLIGIDAYPSVAPLRGCVADVADVRDLLTLSYGFDPASVFTLTDREATRDNILDRMAAVRRIARDDGDRVHLHVSSHGTRTVDLDGDEDDGFDEAIVPWDADPTRPASLILDDAIGQWLATFPPGVDVAVTMDCCHSGTGSRDVRSGAVRFVPPAPDVEARANRTLARRPQPIPVPPRGVPGPGLLILSACGPEQTAAEAAFGSTYRGVFTWNLCRILRDRVDIGRAELLRKLERGIASGGFRQSPAADGRPKIGPLYGPRRRDRDGADPRPR